MNDTVRFTCPACRKAADVTLPEVARPRAGKGKNDPLELIRVTCPHCGRVVQLSRLRK